MIRKQNIDARAALRYWGLCYQLRQPDEGMSTSVRSLRRELGSSALTRERDRLLTLYRSDERLKAIRKAYNARIKKASRLGYGNAVVPTDGRPYGAMFANVYSLKDDPYEGSYVFLAVELALLELKTSFRAMAVWIYVKEEKVRDLPSPQTTAAKYMMHTRLVDMVEEILNISI